MRFSGKHGSFFLLGILLLAAPVFSSPQTLDEFLKSRKLDGYYASSSTPPGERRMMAHAHHLISDPGVSTPFKRAMEKRLTDYRRYRREKDSRKSRVSPPPLQAIGRVYASPSPTRGQDPVLRVETGPGSQVEVQVLTMHGVMVHHAELTDSGVAAEGGLTTYEGAWPLGRAASGVYLIKARVRRDGSPELKGAGQVTVAR